MKQLLNHLITKATKILNQVQNSKATILSIMILLIVQSQLVAQSMIDKLKSGQSESEEVASEGVDAFLGYVDIFVAVLFVFWIVQAFRNSRANSDDDSGEGFSIIKWGSWRAGVIIFYTIARVAIIPNIF